MDIISRLDKADEAMGITNENRATEQTSAGHHDRITLLAGLLIQCLIKSNKRGLQAVGGCE